MHNFKLPERRLKDKVTSEEWALRIDLATCYRIIAHYGWDDTIYTHISAKIPGKDEYLVNAFGLIFDEITASNLVKVNLEGDILDEEPLFLINPVGYTIHSAIHSVRQDVGCILHLHTNATISVATQKSGLQPLSQYAMLVLNSLSYHGYEGLAVNQEEKTRLQNDLGDNNFMLLPNHGALTVGGTVGAALMRFYNLQCACEVQLMMQSTKEKMLSIPPTVLEKAKEMATIVYSDSVGGTVSWPAMLRLAYRLDPSYIN